ncbi:MAG: radical SAM protein [Sulfuricellaceae bacterium]|nr:radical SAM protein [Sulfuricellaceae bacterium]
MVLPEALEDIRLDADLVEQCVQQQGTHPAHALNFHSPGFKTCATSCGNKQWPAISITGADCKLQCDHCKAKILEPMQAARTPDDLWRIVNGAMAGGAKGMLLTGGSSHRNEVDYSAFFPTLRRIKTAFPQFAIAAHTALVNRETAQRMADAGIDTAMLDIIGAQDTISQVYHLKRPVADFEHSLACLADTRMRVVPHIVIGLHYGKLLGEWYALEILQRHPCEAVVLVVAMPFYAPPGRPFATPDSRAVGRFFLDARKALPDTSLSLGCARPAGRVKLEIESYAVLAGLDGLAHPSEGITELAAQLGRKTSLSPTCCSMMNTAI